MMNRLLKRLLDALNAMPLKTGSAAADSAKPGTLTEPTMPVERLDIPEGTEEIPRGALKGRRELVSVSVPSSVRKIGEMAFADCERLESVTLSEGLTAIGDNAFSGCGRLRSVIIPDSVRVISGFAFKNSGVTEPVLNLSGDTLFYCPAAVGEEFSVPKGVRRIGSRAFFELSDLKRIRFPKSLERIDKLAFVKCGIESVTLPKWFEKLEEGAFFKCGALKPICFEDGFDKVRAAILSQTAMGSSFLAPVWCPPPQSDPYWRGREFRALAERCAAGNREAMERMADFFEEKSKAAPEEPFYSCAANFWGFRAYENGSQIRKRRLEDYIKSAPGKRLPSAYLNETLHGTAKGETLNALGFMFFAPDREYTLAGLDDDGVVEASSYESEDGPNEDGFGRETYYDWWYLDGDLCPVPGVDCLHSYSNIDRRICDVRKRFEKAHDVASRAVVAENLRRGLDFERENLLEEAYSRYKMAADSGSAKAMYAIGNLYFYSRFRGIPNIFAAPVMPGDDVPVQPDTLSAFRWFMKAARVGSVDAMGNVGVMLVNGVGCKRDDEKGREWLEKAAKGGSMYAAKALHDFFDVPISDVLTDEAYDRLVDDFCAAADASGTVIDRSVFERLTLGTDGQLSRLGLRLAEGRYGRGGSYWEYAYPNLDRHHSSAPVVSLRCGWASAIVVNLRAFPEGEPALTFASDIRQDLVPVCGVRESGERVEYDASGFGWLNRRRRARVLRPAPGYVNKNAAEELKYCGVDIPKLLEYLKLTEYEALFIENGEKEYSVELGYLAGDELRVLLRYTEGGWDQGNGPAEVSGVVPLAAGK